MGKKRKEKEQKGLPLPSIITVPPSLLSPYLCPKTAWLHGKLLNEMHLQLKYNFSKSVG
jgi:hypothetical protein